MDEYFKVVGLISTVVMVGVCVGLIGWMVVGYAIKKHNEAQSKANELANYTNIDFTTYDSAGNIKRIGDELRSGKVK